MKRLILTPTASIMRGRSYRWPRPTNTNREFLPADDAVIEGVCPFAVGADILANNSYIKTFSDGRQPSTER